VRLTVLIPTYKRPEDLRRCLDAVALQTRKPDDVIVVVRDTDEATQQMLRTIDAPERGIRTVFVTDPGQVQALNAGLAETNTDIVAITDDDAVPHPDWTERIVARFETRCDIGGVGGRDRLHDGGILQEGRATVVGRVPLIGRHIGNHHLGFGAAREVDVIKGVNGSYRTQAIRDIGFDTRLRGTGAQVHWEISLGIALRRSGWKLVYDPAILVDHFLAKRFDEDQRKTFNPLAMENAAYNETLIRMDQLSPAGGIVFVAWAVLIGTRATPGLVQWLRFRPSQGELITLKLRAALKGRFLAWNDVRCQFSTTGAPGTVSEAKPPSSSAPPHQ
jgi:GT2 family glycosyltransferase